LVAFLGATFIWTLGEILLATNGNVFVNRHAPSTHRARFNSLVSVAVGIGSTIGPTAGGLLLSVAGFSTLWFSAVGVAMVVGVLFLMLRRMVIRSEAGC
jgi:MFS family permease